jgi:hypothetical protein
MIRLAVIAGGAVAVLLAVLAAYLFTRRND